MATASEKNKSSKAGEDKSRTQQTSKEAEERKDALPTSPEKREESDPRAAATGSTVGGVVDGDVLGKADYDDDKDEDKAEEFVEAAAEGGLDFATGTVVERNVHGEEFDVPWATVTVDRVARTSDSDDPTKAWTAQEASGERKDDDGNDLAPVALVEVQGTPGQTFRVRELPNRAVAEAAGIDWELWVAGLPVRADVPDEGLRQGLPG